MSTSSCSSDNNVTIQSINPIQENTGGAAVEPIRYNLGSRLQHNSLALAIISQQHKIPDLSPKEYEYVNRPVYSVDSDYGLSVRLNGQVAFVKPDKVPLTKPLLGMTVKELHRKPEKEAVALLNGAAAILNHEFGINLNRISLTKVQEALRVVAKDLSPQQLIIELGAIYDDVDRTVEEVIKIVQEELDRRLKEALYYKADSLLREQPISLEKIARLFQLGLSPHDKPSVYGSHPTLWDLAMETENAEVIRLFATNGAMTEILCHLCLNGGNAQFVKSLLLGCEKEALNSLNFAKMTPLACAIESCNPELVHALVDAGADIEKKSKVQVGSSPDRRAMQSPLLQVAQKACIKQTPIKAFKAVQEIASILAKAGAVITPDFWKLKHFNNLVLDWVEKGAKLHPECDSAEFAAEKGNLQLLRRQLKKIENSTDKQEKLDTLLELAFSLNTPGIKSSSGDWRATYDSVGVISLLMRRGAKMRIPAVPEQISAQSVSASSQMNTEQLCDLCSSPAKLAQLKTACIGVSNEILNGHNSQKMTPLATAIDSGNLAAVQILIEARADLGKESWVVDPSLEDSLLCMDRNKPRMAMRAPIWQAVPKVEEYGLQHKWGGESDVVRITKGSWKMVFLLAQAGVELPEELWGLPKFHGAASLLNQGARLRANTQKLDFLIMRGELELFDRVFHNVRQNSSTQRCKQLLRSCLRTAAKWRGSLPVVRLLHEKYGANIHEVDKEGHTALSLAAHFGNRDIVRYLLLCGAKAGHLQPGYLSNSALTGAVKKHDETMVHLLLRNGADPSKEYGVWLPLLKHMVEGCSAPGSVRRIATLLRKKGLTTAGVHKALSKKDIQQLNAYWQKMKPNKRIFFV